MKPYAYAVVQGNDEMENVSLQFDHPEMCGQKYRQAIPLFTHPAELTDEEIHAVWASGEYYTLDKDGSIDEFHFSDFAKAILRKAQEK